LLAIQVFPLSVQEFFMEYIQNAAFWKDVGNVAGCSNFVIGDWLSNNICCLDRVLIFTVQVKHFLTSIGIGTMHA
jgi:hypothetical protein